MFGIRFETGTYTKTYGMDFPRSCFFFVFFFCCFRNRKKEWMEKEKLNSPGSRLLISFSDSYSNHKNRDDWKMENLLRFLSLFLFPFSCLPPIDFINSCFASFSKSRESDIIEVLLDCDAYVFLSLLCTLPKRQLSSKCSNFYFSKHNEEEGKRAENWLTDNWQLSISASTSAQPVVKSFRLNSRVLFFLFALKKKNIPLGARTTETLSICRAGGLLFVRAGAATCRVVCADLPICDAPINIKHINNQFYCPISAAAAIYTHGIVKHFPTISYI